MTSQPSLQALITGASGIGKTSAIVFANGGHSCHVTEPIAGQIRRGGGIPKAKWGQKWRVGTRQCRVPGANSLQNPRDRRMRLWHQ